jgi:hypothetical protein
MRVIWKEDKESEVVHAHRRNIAPIPIDPRELQDAKSTK